MQNLQLFELSREVCGVVEILRSENVGEDEVVGEAGEGFARVSCVGIAEGALACACASFNTERRVGRHGWRVRVVVARTNSRCVSIDPSERLRISETKNH